MRSSLGLGKIGGDELNLLNLNWIQRYKFNSGDVIIPAPHTEGKAQVQWREERKKTGHQTDIWWDNEWIIPLGYRSDE